MSTSNEVVKGHDPDKFCRYCGAGEGYEHSHGCPGSVVNVKSVSEIHVVYRVRDCLPLIAFTDNKVAWDAAAEQHAHNPDTAYGVHTINLVDGGE